MAEKAKKKKSGNKSNRRYLGVLVFAYIAAFVIVGRALEMKIVQQKYWEVVAKRFVQSQRLDPVRGEILAADGQVLVSSLPEYEIAIEFVATDPNKQMQEKIQAFRDSVYPLVKDSICEGLHSIFPKYKTQWFRERLDKGYKRRSKWWPILNKRITYEQFLQCKELPLFRESEAKGGFRYNRIMMRKKIFGSLASRTLGDYGKKDSDSIYRGTKGLEACYDTTLCGSFGWGHTEKTGRQTVTEEDIKPQNGHDIVTTIDVTLQDIAEKAMSNQMRNIGATKGIVVLMEVATGDVKAMVNLARKVDSTGDYELCENEYNYALNGRWEPGSTFKTASMMVAMEDGYITPDYIVDTGNGVKMMHGSRMIDHNAGAGNSVPRVLNVVNIMKSSSNVGVSTIIDDFYYNEPEKFVDGLYRIGVGIDLGLPMGIKPSVRRPERNKRGQFTNWSKTTLPWMSIGYETSIPPISTLAFYNAIANGGRMMRPRFVTAELNNGQVVREYPPVCIKEKICSDKTLRYIHDILDSVVNAPRGTGAKAGNPNFHVCGKTGTAQLTYSKVPGVKKKYLISFCGFYPSEAPKYSSIVCMEKEAPAYGGAHCGPVFREISLAAMNLGVLRDPRLAADSTSVRTPQLSVGSMEETRSLLTQMNIPWHEDEKSDHTWGLTMRASNDRSVSVAGTTSAKAGTVPNVTGMGAREAVYALRQAGLRVKLRGQGLVCEQSIPAGTKINGKPTININLR